MAHDNDRERAKDILDALDRSFELEEALEKRDDDEKAARLESTLIRLKDADPPPAK